MMLWKDVGWAGCYFRMMMQGGWIIIRWTIDRSVEGSDIAYHSIRQVALCLPIASSPSLPSEAAAASIWRMSCAVANVHKACLECWRRHQRMRRGRRKGDIGTFGWEAAAA